MTNLCVYWDQIYLSEDTAPPNVHLTPIDAETAGLTLRGFSRAIVDARHEQPEYFDYPQWQPAAMWNPVAGALYALRRCARAARRPPMTDS